MSNKNQTIPSVRIRSLWIFLIYIAVVAKLVLLRMPIANILENIGIETAHRKMSTANLVPLHTIKMYSRWQNIYWANVNLVGNVVVFIPLGFLLPHTFKKLDGFFKTFFVSLLIILFIEFGQLFTGVGEFDVDDILLNLIGSMSGYIIYAIRKFVRRHSVVSE